MQNIKKYDFKTNQISSIEETYSEPFNKNSKIT